MINHVNNDLIHNDIVRIDQQVQRSKFDKNRKILV
jgi:hypothetical protein